MQSPSLEYNVESLYRAKGITLKIGDITYDLVAEDVADAIEKITDPDCRGQITVHLHRSVRGTGRLAHVEVHALSLEVEARYIQIIDFSDRIQVQSYERRRILSIFKKVMEEYHK